MFARTSTLLSKTARLMWMPDKL